jgi:hypothetical protein
MICKIPLYQRFITTTTIWPTEFWSLMTDDAQLDFHQQIIVEQYGSVIKRIILSTTVMAVTYKNQNYDCYVIGD